MRNDEPLRIVFNGRFLTQVQTGVQRYARETLLAFDALLARRTDLRRRIHAQLAVPADSPPLPLQQIETRTLAHLRGHLWEQVSLAWFARDAFLVNFNYSGPIAKRRQLVTVHDATVAVSPETFSMAYRTVHRALIRVLRHRAAAVMTVSNFSRGEIAHHFGIDRHIVVGREGWEHAKAIGDDRATLVKYGLSSGEYVLAVGSMKPNKNFRLLGDALHRLGGYRWPIAIAGARDARVFRGAEVPADLVRLLGFVSDAELGHLYRHAAWLVLPSLYEGFGLPAVEAMGNGCPVLAARAASIPEVCGDAALYFDPHDVDSLVAALREAAANPQLREELNRRAQARLAIHSWHANAELLATAVLGSSVAVATSTGWPRQA
jgi:glycosyltransferase involved in cell wall biosynthesis